MSLMVKRVRGPRWFLIAMFVTCGTPSLSHSEAFRVLDQGAAASGQGTAFAAQADDPSAVHYNPAGITQLPGVQFYGGIMLVGGHYDYTSPNHTSYRANLDGTIAVPPPVNFYITTNLSRVGTAFFKNLSIGLGLNSPYGLIINYPRDVPFRALNTGATLPLLDIKPTLAYRVNDYLSIGGGVDIYTFTSLAGAGALQSHSLVPPNTALELNAKDTAFGYNVGLLLTPWRTEGQPRLNVVVVYRSQATLNLQGELLRNGVRYADAEVDLTLPEIVTGAVAYWPIRDAVREWKLEVDIDYANWHSFKQVDLRQSNGTVQQKPRNWNGVFIIRTGTEYKWIRPSILPEWDITARLGYIRSQTPVPERTFEPAVPDANYNSFSLGLGFHCKGKGNFLGFIKCQNHLVGPVTLKGIGLDLAYKNQIYESRTITNNIQPVVNGTWETLLHAGVMSIRMNF